MTPEELFEQNQGLVFLTLKRMLPNHYTDPDLQQEAQMALWQAAVNFDDSMGYAFSTFAVKCIHNRLVRIIKAWSRKCRSPSGEVISVNDSVSKDSAETLESQIIGDIDVMFVDIQSAFSQLNAEEMEVVRLLYSGYKQYEIKEIMGISKPTIIKRTRSAKKKLEAYL